MTDLGRAMRDVAETTSAETVAPPFAHIERRHRARRARQVALAGVAAVAIGGIAVAAPDLTRRAGVTPARPTPAPSVSLRPPSELMGNAQDTEAVTACVEAAGFTLPSTGLPFLPSGDASLFDVAGFPEVYDRCLDANGYRTFAVETQIQRVEAVRRAQACGVALQAGVHVAGGTHRGARWEMRVAFTADGVICLRHDFDGWQNLVGYGNVERRSPAEPDDNFVKGKTRGSILLYGWSDPRAARIDVVVNGVRYRTSGSRAGDLTFYAIPLTLPPGRVDYTVQAYDAQGGRLGLKGSIVTSMD